MMISAFLFVFNTLISFAILVVIVAAVLHLLIAFDVINMRNPTVYRISTALERLTEPMLAPIRRVIPIIAGIDFSPWVLIVLLKALQILVNNVLSGNIFG